MQSIFEICHLIARLNKLLDDVEIIAISMTETLGVVQDEVRILGRGKPFLDIGHAGFATVLHSLQFEVSRLSMSLSA